ncbi:TetR/AcrR family transcriptional regulator [Actinosynnema sp. NPDC047251]|uniref:Transcriptional regulator n=1 Tax=Saccharothrix espanaensis (strain ATCC 51144 / DSM 44229 / JCM 9112 / NBRC 15066 / NRRL 15764) TaxID=1179773 RepID=K0K0U8_SACES|nr:TetR/AcrR family transcriptional regulator [Saccharothrix espanaensis]CCH31157.1 Transcriptional regulator [Saccharothrix espanaensis DSM 44229]
MTGRPYHHGDLRGALLDAAESLVRERGADGWSLREVSARVGVSPSAAYHHFASRDALVRALAGRVLAGLGDDLRHAAARARGQRADPLRRLVALGRGYVRWTLAEPAVAALAFGPHHDEPGAPHPHDVLCAELDRLVAAGGLSDAARPGAEFAFWAAVHGLATLLRDGLIRLDGPRAVDREAERLVRAVLTGLAEPSHPSRARSAHTERSGVTTTGTSGGQEG